MVFEANDDGDMKASSPQTTNERSDSSTLKFSSNKRFTDLVHFLAKESSDRLARLAVAFSPPERRITLQDIQHVEVTSIDEEHIDIEAVLCEHESCVSVSIPVSFLNSCVGSAEVEECILGSVGSLDVKASEILFQSDLDSAHEHERLEEDRLMENLKSRESFTLPNWWVFAHDPAMVSECLLLRNLLNEADMAPDIQKIAQQVLEMTNPGKFHVVRAAIVDVGPAGLLLRAAISELMGPSPLKNVEVPMAFRGAAVDTVSLRNIVLNIIDSA